MTSDPKKVVEKLRRFVVEDGAGLNPTHAREALDLIEAQARRIEELTEYSEDITARFKRQVQEIGPAIVARAEAAEARMAELTEVLKLAGRGAAYHLAKYRPHVLAAILQALKDQPHD